MVKIPCLECGKTLKIPSYINPEDYDGQFRCHVCNALLYIRFKSSEVKKYSRVEKPPEVERHVEIKYELAKSEDELKEG